MGVVGTVRKVFYSNGKELPLRRPGVELPAARREYNFYFQDDWRSPRRLTLNLGVRYEFNSVPVDLSGMQVVNDKPLNSRVGDVALLPAGPGTDRSWYNNDHNNFAPSVGFAWTPFGDNKTAIRGGFRTAYNRLVNWALNVVEQNQPGTTRTSIIRPNSGASSTNPTTVRASDAQVQTLVAPAPQRHRRPAGAARRAHRPQLDAAAVRPEPPHPVRQPVEPQHPAPDRQGYGGRARLRRQQGHPHVPHDEREPDRPHAGVHRRLPRRAGGRPPGHRRPPARHVRRNAAVHASPPTSPTTTSAASSPPSTPAPSRSTVSTSADVSSRPGCAQGYFRNPQFTTAALGCSCTDTSYNSLQVSLNQRFSRSMMFMTNYTWAKSLDDISDDTDGAGQGLLIPTDSNNRRLDRGRCSFDIRHQFRAGVIYELPSAPASSGYKAACCPASSAGGRPTPSSTGRAAIPSPSGPPRGRPPS